MTEKEFIQFWKIYDESFPNTEKRTLIEQKNLLKNKEYDIILYYENERVIGFISLWNFEKFVFIEHLAISEEYRGMGIGSKIVKDMKLRFIKSLILEVELPKNTINKRRIDFYTKAGFYYNNFSYIQPPYQKEEKPIELSIMSYPNALSISTFNYVRDMLYTRVYKTNK